MREIYAQIAETIISELENAKPGGILPWHRSGGGLAKNALTKKSYRGGNRIILWVTAQSKQYSSGQWASYKQWAELGAQVSRGEKATRIIAPIPIKDDDGVEDRMIFVARAVFNRNQTDLAEDVQAQGVKDGVVLTDTITPDEQAEALIKATGAVIKVGGQRAFYTGGDVDTITMPDRRRFTGTDTMTATEGWYSTLLHELVHWTGSSKRLAREGITDRKRSKTTYAFEELIAEFGAAFLCQQVGITATLRDDHAIYIADWVRVLKNDPKVLFKAAGAAEKASDYLLETQEKTEEVEEAA